MTQSITVVSVNISTKKGTIKHPVPKIDLNFNGIETDAHSGKWHRQVSLLGLESVEKFSVEAGRTIQHGEFAENITSKGVTLYETHPLDRFVGEKVTLEVTQIGKKCHGSNCQIYREVGNCVMPKEGIFARVITPGSLQSGDVLTYVPRVIRVGIITLSDRASEGVYEDLSGKEIERYTKEHFLGLKRPVSVSYHLIPDDSALLQAMIEQLVEDQMDVIFTTGGTGIGPKDITPDVIKPMLDKEIPGIMELVRVKYGTEKPAALLSRSIAGVISNTLIYCLPGSVKAVKEYMHEIYPTVMHSLYMLHGLDLH